MYVFNGPEYDPARDNDRLIHQIARVYAVMSDGVWRTCAEVAALTTRMRESGVDPENSIQAQWRHLRKARWGGHTVERRSRSGSLFEYRLIPSGRGLINGPLPSEEEVLRDKLEDLVEKHGMRVVVRHLTEIQGVIERGEG